MFGISMFSQLKSWINIAFVVIIISLSATIMFQKMRISNLKNEVDKNLVEISVLKGNQQILQDHINVQNAAVDKYTERSKQFEQQTKELTNKLQESQTKSKNNVEQILKSTKPDTCEKSIELLRDSIGELKWDE